MFVLAVQVEQPLAELLERGECDAGLVDRRAAASFGAHLAAHDEQLAVEVRAPFVEQRGDALRGVAAQAELAFDDRGLRPFAHDIRVGARADEQAERRDDQ
ncbi:MAG: hypothetical protein IPJ04_06265 [Candidatus Eisenbacteria bacterium]|nr:hypothetical protein [Candidatus Eisenbacteria bacterium]